MKVISNLKPSFAGAYIISGKGKDVKKAEYAIKNEIGKNNGYNTLGDGYVLSDSYACLLVTTEEKDTIAYNKYILSKKSHCNDIKYELGEEDFENPWDYLCYKIKQKADNAIESLKKNCKFKSELNFVEAKDALEAMKDNKFDYINGICKD